MAESTALAYKAYEIEELVDLYFYRRLGYVVAQADTADWLPSLGCSAAGSNCMRFNDAAIYNIRVQLLLAGMRLPTQGARPSNNYTDYVEHQNADGGSLFEQRRRRTSKSVVSSPFYAPFNDRIILVDWDAASLPNATQISSTSPLRVVTLP